MGSNNADSSLESAQPNQSSRREASNQVRRKTEIRYVPIAVIWPNPDNPRFFKDPDAVPKLAANMKATGQRTPIKLVALTLVEKLTHPGYEYKLLGGHLRREAALSLGWETLEAMILDLTPEEAELEMDLDNSFEELHWLDRYRIIERHSKSKPKITQEEIGARLRIDQSMISRALQTVKYLNRGSRELIYGASIKSKGDPGIGQRIVWALASLEDAEKVEKALQVALDLKMNEDQAKKLVASVKAGNQPEDFKLERAPKAGSRKGPAQGPPPVEPAWKPVSPVPENPSLPLTKIPLNRVRVLREMEFTYHPIHIERHAERIKEGPVISAVPITLKVRPLSEAEKAADPGHDYELYAGILHFQGLERAGVGEAEAYIHEGIERWEALGLSFGQNPTDVLPWVEIYAVLEDRIRERPGEPPEKLVVELWENPEKAKMILEVMKLLSQETREIIWENMYGCLEGWADPNEYGFTQMLARQLIGLEKADPDPDKVKKLVKKTVESAIEYKVEFNELGQLVMFVLEGNDPEDFFVEEE